MNRLTATVRVPLVLWAAAMLLVSSLPGTRMPQVSLWQWDKLAHFAEYTVLAILAARYFQLVRSHPAATAALLAGLATVIFAFLDETHQLLIPNRACSWQDLAADAVGATVGVAIFAWHRHRRLMA